MAEAAETGTRGMGQQALAVVERGRKRLEALPSERRNWLLGGALMLAALIAGGAWLLNRPEWRILYSGLEARDASTVEQELGAAGIAYRATADQSGIEVPAELLDKARMEIAAKGMPQSGRLGFELFDKPNWVGSEFDEKVNYQRAMEGELEHTIGSLGEIRQARVHLVLPQPSLFSQEGRPAKASVVLKLRRPSLTAEQVESIRRLVAGAVEDLSSENVTLVDSDGRQDFTAKNSRRDGDAAAELEAKLVMMLEPLAGAGNVRAVANVTYDEGSEEKTDEVYDPSLTGTLSMQKTQQTNENPGRAQGVPGTASNTPAAAPPGAVQGSAQAAAPGIPPLLQAVQEKPALPVYPQPGNGPGQTMTEETGTYAVSKHLSHREEGPGRMQKVTVAVVVNDRRLTEGEGKLAHEVWKPRSSEEMHRLEELAQAAIGYDSKRGDSVVVENLPFSSNAPEPVPIGGARVFDEAKSLLETQPGALRLGLMGVLGILLVMAVLRPVSRQLIQTLRQPATVPAERALPAGMETAGLEAGEAFPGELPVTFDERGRPVPQKPAVERVSEFIRHKPAESSRMLETWILQREDN